MAAAFHAACSDSGEVSSGTTSLRNMVSPPALLSRGALRRAAGDRHALHYRHATEREGKGQSGFGRCDVRLLPDRRVMSLTARWSRALESCAESCAPFIVRGAPC